jgi:hypothetical protein
MHLILFLSSPVCLQSQTMSGSEELINHNERSRAGVPPDWFLHHGYFEAAQSAHRRLQQHLGVMIHREWSVDHLLAFIDMETERIRSGAIKMGTLLSTLSRITSVQQSFQAHGSDWSCLVRKHHRAVNCLKALSQVRIQAPRPTEHDYAVSLVELRRFTRQLDAQSWEDVVLGAVSTSLFWGLGRTFELLLADKWDPLPLSALAPAKRPEDLACRSIHLFQPKRPRSLKGIEVLSPVPSDCPLTNAAIWLGMLEAKRPDGAKEHLFQLSDGGRMSSTQFLEAFRRRSSIHQRIGVCSLRAGGATHLAEQGVALDTIRLLGRWSSDAWKNYIHSYALIAAKHAAGRIGVFSTDCCMLNYVSALNANVFESLSPLNPINPRIMSG